MLCNRQAAVLLRAVLTILASTNILTKSRKGVPLEGLAKVGRVGIRASQDGRHRPPLLELGREEKEREEKEVLVAGPGRARVV